MNKAIKDKKEEAEKARLKEWERNKYKILNKNLSFDK